MLIQNIKPYYFQGFAAVKNNAAEKQNAAAKNKDFKNAELISYPANYYLPVSFGRQLTHSEIIKKIDIENFPSPKIAEIFEAEKDKSLYEVHKEYYSPLLDCETLEEAKEQYPEFEDVIDAKDVNINELDSRNILKKIADKKLDGASLDNLSLELLKKHYAEIKSIKQKEIYFNLSKSAVDRLFKILNVKKMNRNYTYSLAGSNPGFKVLIGNISKNAWAQDDGTRRKQAGETIKRATGTPEAREAHRKAVQSEEFRAVQREHAGKLNTPAAIAARQQTMHTDEYREKKRLISQQIWDADDGTMRKRAREQALVRWAADDGTMREKSRYTASTALQTAESREKQKATMQTDEYREKKRLISQQIWDADDGTMRERVRQIASTVLQQEENRDKNRASLRTPEARQKRCEITLARWAADDGTMRERARQVASTVLQTTEVIAKRNEKFQSAEYREARREAYRRHPEITEMMSKIAKEFPMLTDIREKERRGKELTETEQRIRETYWKRTHEAMPGYAQIIGDEYHKILVEWGLKDE